MFHRTVVAMKFAIIVIYFKFFPLGVFFDLFERNPVDKLAMNASGSLFPFQSGDLANLSYAR